MADINTVLVKDKRIQEITDMCDYAVYSGASSNTYQQFQASTLSASNISFNVQVPSENTLVDRNVLMTSKVNFSFVITNVQSGSLAFAPGINDALQAFPLNKLFLTSSATINNSSVSVNTQDVIDALLKQIPQNQLAKYQGMTPAQLDGAYKNYTDGQNVSNSSIGGYQTASLNNEYVGRGSHPITINAWKWQTGNTVTPNNLLSGNVTDVFYINCSVKLTEPLMCLSPFLFGGDNQFNSQALVGINSINLVMNIDTTLKRFLSSILPTGATYVSAPALGNQQFIIPTGAGPVNTAYGTKLDAFQDTALLLNFLTSQPTDLIKSKSVVGYSDFPRYVFSNLTSLGAQYSKNTYVSQNIQLNQIPDRFFIYVRKQMSSQTINDSASFYPITGISVNFSNASGLLSSATQQDLWKMSVENGCNQSWLEFSGYANKYSALSATSNTLVPTGGSVLVINPAKDLSLPSYLSNGSLGQYSLQFNITVENNGTTTPVPEIVVVCQNSGVFVTQSGSSSIFTGVLSKQMVLDAVSNQEAFNSSEYDRLVGGMKMSSALRAVPRPMKRVAGAMSAGVRSAGLRKLDAMAM